MALVESGGTYVKASSTPASASALIDFIETQLPLAGWTVTSGAGTDNITLQTANSAEGHAVRVRFVVNSTRVEIYLQTSAGSEASNMGAVLNVGGSDTFWIVASQHSAFIYDAAYFGVARKWAAMGVPSVPSHLQAGTTNIGYLFSAAAQSNTSSTVRIFLSSGLLFTSAPSPMHTCLKNSNFQVVYNTISTSQLPGQLAFAAPCVNPRSNSIAVTGLAWANGDRMIFDPLLAWATSGSEELDAAVIQGQIYNTVIVYDDLGLNTEIVIDSKRFNVVARFAGASNASNFNAPPFSILHRIPNV